jgi:hypothetical protein
MYFASRSTPEREAAGCISSTVYCQLVHTSRRGALGRVRTTQSEIQPVCSAPSALGGDLMAAYSSHSRDAPRHLGETSPTYHGSAYRAVRWLLPTAPRQATVSIWRGFDADCSFARRTACAAPPTNANRLGMGTTIWAIRYRLGERGAGISTASTQPPWATSSNNQFTRRGLRPLVTAGEVVSLRERR